MPTYDYRCLDCQHHYEKREGFDAPALQKCPTCGGKARRVLHAPSVVFKGSGFYVTDNRKSAPEAEPATADRSAAKAESPAADKPPPKADEGATADKPAPADKPAIADKPAAAAKPASKNAEPAAAS